MEMVCDLFIFPVPPLEEGGNLEGCGLLYPSPWGLRDTWDNRKRMTTTLGSGELHCAAIGYGR